MSDLLIARDATLAAFMVARCPYLPTKVQTQTHQSNFWFQKNFLRLRGSSLSFTLSSHQPPPMRVTLSSVSASRQRRQDAHPAKPWNLYCVTIQASHLKLRLN
eukprot:1141017-Pelagomonas_calceolata.AAC.4